MIQAERSAALTAAAAESLFGRSPVAMTPVASVEEGQASERRDEAASQVDVVGLKTITSYLKSYLTTTGSGSG